MQGTGKSRSQGVSHHVPEKMEKQQKREKMIPTVASEIVLTQEMILRWTKVASPTT